MRAIVSTQGQAAPAPALPLGFLAPGPRPWPPPRPRWRRSRRSRERPSDGIRAPNLRLVALGYHAEHDREDDQDDKYEAHRRAWWAAG